MFDLVRPCMECPFRKGWGERYRLHLLRLREIKRATAFPCHKTCSYDESDDGRTTEKSQQCAGLMAVLARDGEPNQIMQLGERFRALDLSLLDPFNEAYDSWDDVIAAHKQRRR